MKSTDEQAKRARPARVWLLPMALGLAAALLLVLAVSALLRGQEPERQPRGGEEGSPAWGLRAFCIDPKGQVQGEAGPRETLACARGSAVRFSYTAPEAARLGVMGMSPSGEPLQFFPREGLEAEVAPGVDVLLPYSTPVQEGWPSVPVEVRARFTDASGRLLAEPRLMLFPR